MSSVLKVTKVEKVVSPADNGVVLEVEFTISEGEQIDVRKLSFPLNTSADSLKAELTKYKETYDLEKKQALESAAQNEAEKQADETIAAVSDLSIGGEETVPTVEGASVEAPQETQPVAVEEVSAPAAPVETPTETVTEPTA